MIDHPLPTYAPKDFASDQEVRWCPGCGDYAVLKAVQMAMPHVGRRREDMVFVSGIGCAARFPYYMATYGLHSIHGRAPAFATGIRLANPDLQVWLVSGDGDLLSIGGNHTMHLFRRNVDVNVLLLNNRIYGLTKGQYSPTSEVGKRTKSTPMGSIDRPVRPLALALACGAGFVARCLDVDVKGLAAICEAAAAYPGTAFVEVYQDCNIFNHQAWFYASQKGTRAETTFTLEAGKPMRFGADGEKGLRLLGTRIEVVELGVNGVTEADLLVHDERDPMLAWMLANLEHPAFPEPMGILHRGEPRPVYEREVAAQVEQAVARRGVPDIAALMHAGDTWEIPDRG